MFQNPSVPPSPTALSHEADDVRYRRMQRNTIVAVSAAFLVPLLAVTAVNYVLYKQAYSGASAQQVLGVVAVTRHALESFLDERIAAAEYVVSREHPSDLLQQSNMESIFARMKEAFGGLVDIGVVDASGILRTYVGPYGQPGKDYSRQAWFMEMKNRDVYVSDVFLGYRGLPHFVIAVRRVGEDGRPLVFRASIDMHEIERRIADAKAALKGDAFLWNPRGTLGTTSALYGEALSAVSLPIRSAERAEGAVRSVFLNGAAYVLGSAPVHGTPFIFVVMINRENLFHEWTVYERETAALLLFFVPLVLAVVIGVTRRSVSRIQEAEKRREDALHTAEHAGKMASLGRLAAGVAHEINNPLAVINEKAGLIEDLLVSLPDSPARQKMSAQTEGIQRSVDRCSKITRRLLGFSRTEGETLEPLCLKETLEEVLSFLDKEAAYRAVGIEISVPEALPDIVSDRTSLQQLFLNLAANALDAMEGGGTLRIVVERSADNEVSISFVDTGCGIDVDHLERVFEPFFSTKKAGGTGLGLYISYGIVRRLGGTVSVASAVGEGARFTVRLPITPKQAGEHL